MDKKVAKLQKFCQQHEELVAEEFFLNVRRFLTYPINTRLINFFFQQRGVILDFAAWRKNPTQDILAHLKANALDISDVVADSKPPAEVLVAAPSSPPTAPPPPPKEIISVVPPAVMTPVKIEPVVEPLTINIRGKPKISLPERRDDAPSNVLNTAVVPSVVVSDLTTVLTVPDDAPSSSSASSCATPVV